LFIHFCNTLMYIVKVLLYIIPFCLLIQWYSTWFLAVFNW
jgi:hypothetical protein